MLSVKLTIKLISTSDEWMIELMDEQMDGWVSDGVDERTDKWMDKCMKWLRWMDKDMRCVRLNNGFMDRRINIWGIWDGRIDESIYEGFGMDGWPARWTNEWGVQLGWMVRQNGLIEICMRCLIWMDECLIEMDYLHLSVTLHRWSSITWLIEQNECWYLWVVVGSSDAAGSAGSLCAGSGPVGDPKAPSEWAWMSLSHTVCNLAD